MNIKYLDLFCGVGGFHQALVGIGECIGACDIDPRPRDVYETNHHIRPWGDIREIDADTLPDFDLLCGGFPCQSFSFAGKQKGFTDRTRGTLFFEIVRIIRAKTPRYVLLENVDNLLRHDGGKTWDIIRQTLTECGYYVHHTVLSPTDIGIPQNRRRVFIYCVRKDLGDIRDFTAPRRARTSIFDILQTDADPKYSLTPDQTEYIDLWGDFVHGVDFDLHGPVWGEYLTPELPADYDSLPDYAKTYARNSRDLYLRHRDFLDDWKRRAETVRMYAGTRRHLEWQAPRRGDIWDNLLQFRDSGLRIRPTTYAPTLLAINQTTVIGPRRRYVTPRECARLQGFPDDFVLDTNDRYAYKQMGNSVCVPLVRMIALFLFGDPQTTDRHSETPLW